ncbi:MAG TPA: right-handed parallel beta-helix repeat-containing protein [Chthoniobacteraceae bacterium]|nr:right-handed parallel beta-helix repeat-containing protein [Chthoniobacteraceae bacterium]
MKAPSKLSLFPSATLALLLLGLSPLAARTWQVDPAKGDDAARAEGEPLRSVAKAIALAQPGDVIEITATQEPLREGIVIANRSGTQEQPIVIEGNGVELLGTAPLPATYEEVRPGVFRFPGLVKPLFGKEPNSKAIGSTFARFFTVWNGKPNHMGRSSKGDRPALPKVEALRPGEWTLEEETLSLVIALEPGRTPEMEKITTPVVHNGVAVRGNSSHWIIRNLNVRQVLNDGFNLHGANSAIVFEKISATECGDDGISAHGTCELKVDGFVGRGNSTGICHINESRSVQENITLVENNAWNLMLLGSGEHVVKKSVVGVGKKGVRFAQQQDGPCRVTLEEVRFVEEADHADGKTAAADGKAPIIHAGKGSEVVFDRVEVLQAGGTVDAGAKVTLRNSRIDAPEAKWEIQPGAAWTADHNSYRLAGLLWNGQAYDAATFADYQKASTQDGDSRWQAGE